MSHATGPRPKRSKKRRNPYQLRIWRCGLCNVTCKTVLAPGGLCSVCRQQPPLPGVDDLPPPRRLCAHADADGEGMHWLEPGEVCDRNGGKR